MWLKVNCALYTIQYKTYIHFAICLFPADMLEPAGMRTSLSNNIALDLPSSALNPDAACPGPLVLSPRLHNKDLAPDQDRRPSMGALRASLRCGPMTCTTSPTIRSPLAYMHWASAAGRSCLSLGIGAELVYFFMNLSGYMGQKTSVPFPVISRISFGIHGAQIPALIRCGHCDCLVSYPNLPGLSGFPRAADGNSSRVCRL